MGTTPPTDVNDNIFRDPHNIFTNPHSDLKIYVPASAIEAYKSAMPTFANKIIAIPNSGGGNGGGGSSSERITKPYEPVTGEIQTEAVVDKNGNTIVNVSDQNITDAIKAAQDVANKKGVNAGEITALINVISPTNSKPNAISVNLPKAVQEQVISSKIGNMTIVIDKLDISVDMNLATITEMNKQANSDIQLSVTRADDTKLSTEAKNALGNRPAFDLKATYENGAKSITNFGEGQVKLEIPYTLQQGEIASEVYAVYVDENGKANTVENSKYDGKTKTLKLSINHFSIYGVGYKTSEIFLDIKDHWPKANIEYILNLGLMTGISQTSFAPENEVTREVFVTALGKLAQIDTNNYQSGKFMDVEEKTSYAPYVNWAVEKGIVVGTSETTFSPNKAITRQEMAVIMSGYAKAQNYEILEIKETVIFADNNQIENWAAPAVNQMQKAGVLNGKDNNIFDPLGTATRGEVCAMLLSYIEFVVKK